MRTKIISPCCMEMARDFKDGRYLHDDYGWWDTELKTYARKCVHCGRAIRGSEVDMNDYDEYVRLSLKRYEDGA